MCVIYSVLPIIVLMYCILVKTVSTSVYNLCITDTLLFNDLYITSNNNTVEFFYITFM